MGLRASRRARRGASRLAPKRDKRDEWGQATVEFAVCLPLVLLLFIGVVQLGLVARDQILLTHAAREVARREAVGDKSARSARQVAAATGLDAERLKIGVTPASRSSDKVMAQLSYRSPVRVVLVGRLLGEITLVSRAAMRHEGRS